VHAAVVGSVQTDLKGMLAYASMTQSGIILAEIGLGLRVVPLVHVVSHAILRSLQILRSPSALHDRHELAAALGGHPGQAAWSIVRLLPASAERRLYRIALDRGFADTMLLRFCVEPVLRLLEAANTAEGRIVAMLGGQAADARGRRRREGGDA
jgi:NADH:ubiquinone oxidoreductase subunit 5 (subunit L)/multisubunit Na+/H+ antiporter MnhA subunit